MRNAPLNDIVISGTCCYVMSALKFRTFFTYKSRELKTLPVFSRPAKFSITKEMIVLHHRSRLFNLSLHIEYASPRGITTDPKNDCTQSTQVPLHVLKRASMFKVLGFGLPPKFSVWPRNFVDLLPKSCVEIFGAGCCGDQQKMVPGRCQVQIAHFYHGISNTYLPGE